MKSPGTAGRRQRRTVTFFRTLCAPLPELRTLLSFFSSTTRLTCFPHPYSGVVHIRRLGLYV